MSHDELERLAASCLFPSFDEIEPPGWVRRFVQEGLGGVVLFVCNVRDRDQIAELTAALRAERADVLIATDEEGGDVDRLEAATGRSYPGNAALGAVDDVSLTEDVAFAIARDLRECGIGLNLAPVADVNTNPLNPVIGTRSFGVDAELVARHTAAFVSGCQAAGVAACAKHFPGHGETEVDSHLAVPAVEVDLETLHDGALQPFHAAIAAGTRAVMTAHVVVPGIDDRPATLSAAILDDLLRDRLGFDGLVMTDALDMAAIASTIGTDEGAVRALTAGADALCLGPRVDGATVGRIRAAVVDAVRAGALAEERLVEAAGRVRSTADWALRAAPAGHAPSDVGLAAARRALVVEGELALTGPMLVVELEAERSRACDPPRVSLADLLDAEGVRVGEAENSALSKGDRQLILVVRDAHRHAWQRRLVAELGPEVVVETGVPEWRPPGVAAYVATHGGGRANLEAAAEAIAPTHTPAA